MLRRLTVSLFAALVLLAACNLSESPALQTAGPPPDGFFTTTPAGGTLAPAGDAPAPTAVPVVVVTLTPSGGAADQPAAADDTLRTTDHAQGAQDAGVLMIHYGDFQCGPCAGVARDLNLLLDRYPDNMQVIFRHFPDVVTNDKSGLALAAAEAAAAQGRFWEMHDLLYAEQEAWTGLTLLEFRSQLTAYARTLELDLDAFEAALDRDVQPLIAQYRAEAGALAIVGIPTLLINGEPYSGAYTLRGLDDAYHFFALEARHYPHQPGLVINLEGSYRARLITEKGDIELELFTALAPVTVNNFVYLAQDGWYNDITFHRVLPGLFAQTGDPSGTGLGGPGYTIVDETGNDLTFDQPGLVAMARIPGQPNSAGSQFFITAAPLSQREFVGFTIFGRVTAGLEVLAALTPRDPLDPINYPDPPPGDRLLRVEIITE